MDYMLCHFYELNAAQRATYVTRGINNAITRRVNDPAYYHIFDNKNEFYAAFSRYIGRKWLYIPETTEEEFAAFMEGREEIICKPSNQCCGRGVEKLHPSDFPSVSAMFSYLRGQDRCLAEEVLRQHTAMDRLNHSAVNTVRIGTLSCDGKPPAILYAFARIGNSDRPVDNLNAGGMCAPVDLDTGVITHPGYDKNGIVYETHPRSGCRIPGFQIPWWKEAARMCLEAASEIPQMGYIGWDVCITETGPVLIEANNLPGHDILQMPPHLPEDKTGMLPRFRAVIPDLKA